MIGVSVLGSTGTIGENTLDVVARNPERFRVVALGARRNVVGMLAQCERFRPDYAAMAEPACAAELEALFQQVKPGRYNSLAITALEQAIMWVVKELTS